MEPWTWRVHSGSRRSGEGGVFFSFVPAVVRSFARPRSRIFSDGRFDEEQSAGSSRENGRDGNMVTEKRLLEQVGRRVIIATNPWIQALGLAVDIARKVRTKSGEVPSNQRH